MCYTVVSLKVFRSRHQPNTLSLKHLSKAFEGIPFTKFLHSTEKIRNINENEGPAVSALKPSTQFSPNRSCGLLLVRVPSKKIRREREYFAADFSTAG